VWQGAINSFRHVVRFEGTAATAGTLGSPTMLWEVSFYANNQMMVVVGTMARSGGTNGLSNGSTFVLAPAFAASTSFALETSNTGATWTFRSGSIIS
jgi:hypothetical protein